MSLVKDLACNKKSKSAFQRRSLSPHRNGLARALAIAECHPSMPPQSRSRDFNAARRVGLRLCTFAHPASAAVEL